MKQRLLVISIFIILTILTGCNNNVQQDNINGNAVASVYSDEKIINVDKLEIYHFHATRQCYSCKTVGAYAKETIDTYFADELKSGKIVFDHINVDLSENKELTIKYGATGSSLWLGIYSKDGKFLSEENVNVWYKIKDKEEYMNYLKGVIEQKLAGN